LGAPGGYPDYTCNVIDIRIADELIEAAVRFAF
jgi:hypothetical protein